MMNLMKSLFGIFLLSTLVFAGSLSAYGTVGSSCPDISGLYEKTTIRSSGLEIKSLLSIYQNGCDDILIMERLHKRYDENFSETKWPEWKSQWTLLTYTPQIFTGSSINLIRPFVLEDGWVRESMHPDSVWSLRKFTQDSLVCGLYDGGQKKLEITPTKFGLDAKYFQLNIENKKWDDSPNGIHLAGRYDSVKYNFKKVNVSNLSNDTEFIPRLNGIVKVEKKSENSFDIKQGICAQATVGGNSFTEWTTMPMYKVLRANLADFIAVPTPNELVSLVIDQTQYCKITADIFSSAKDLTSGEKNWLVPYSVEWCVPNVPNYQKQEDCQKGKRP